MKRDDTIPHTRAEATPVCEVSWLGLVDYAETLASMPIWAARRRDALAPDTLHLLEHPHVITVGKRGTLAHLVATPSMLHEAGVRVHATGRGGDITYHGPGQLVGYPIVDLRALGIGPKTYVALLEDVLVQTLARFGIRAGRRADRPGVWVGDDKIAALGVQVVRGVSAHGFALNVTTDLGFFGFIVPCGIHDGGVTTMARLTGDTICVADVVPVLADVFGHVFQRRMAWTVTETTTTT